MSVRFMTLLATTALISAPALAQQADAPATDQEPAATAPQQDAEAESNAEASPRNDQAIGKRFHVRVEDLPEPYASEPVRNAAVTIERGNRQPTVPDGFSVSLFAEGLKPRQVHVRENGDVLIAEQRTGRIMFLRDEDGDGRAEVVQQFARGFKGPYGMADTDDGDVLVADYRGIWRIPSHLGAVRATGQEIYATSPADQVPQGERRPQTPMDHLPVTDQGVFGGSEGHNTRSLFRDPDDGTLYVGVGSAGNIGEEAPVRATIQAFDADGGNQRTVVTGVRNPIGFDAHPETGQLWATVQERDGLGNEVVPDFMIKVEDGADYGYPHAYLGMPQPGFSERNPDRVEAAQVPPVLFEAHSAAMDFTFYDGDQLPNDHIGDAFVTLKGSWNRADPTGYKVVRVHFENGQPTGSYENFMTGFWVEGDERAVVWGRPADIEVMPDGSLIVIDDTGGTVWKVTYTGDAS